MTEKTKIPERKKRDNKNIKVFKPETPEPSPERALPQKKDSKLQDQLFDSASP